MLLKKKETLPRDVYTHANEIISCIYHGKKKKSVYSQYKLHLIFFCSCTVMVFICHN